MVHALDLDTAKARCIDLPGTGDYLASTAWAMALSTERPHALGGEPVGYGRVVAIDVRTRKVTRAFRFNVGVLEHVAGARAPRSRPDGERIALADGENVAVVGLAVRQGGLASLAGGRGARLLAGREALDVQVAAAGVAA